MTRCLRLSFIDAVTLHPQACCATQSGVPEATVTRLSHNDATWSLNLDLHGTGLPFDPAERAFIRVKLPEFVRSHIHHLGCF